jgi:hypothetical protein
MTHGRKPNMPVVPALADKSRAQDDAAPLRTVRPGPGVAVPVIPLCPHHHTDGGEGHAIHAGRESWEAIHGTELDLLAQVRRELNITEGASA